MAAYDAHGVVVVRVSTGIIHQPQFGSSEGGGHGIATMQTDDWELFPNVVTAVEAKSDFRLCENCFTPPQPRWATGE